MADNNKHLATPADGVRIRVKATGDVVTKSTSVAQREIENGTAEPVSEEGQHGN